MEGPSRDPRDVGRSPTEDGCPFASSIPRVCIDQLTKTTLPKRRRKPPQDTKTPTTQPGNPLLLLGELVFTIGFMFLAELFLPALMHRYLGVNETLGPFIVYGLFGLILGFLLYRYPKRQTDSDGG